MNSCFADQCQISNDVMPQAFYVGFDSDVDVITRIAPK